MKVRVNLLALCGLAAMLAVSLIGAGTMLSNASAGAVECVAPPAGMISWWPGDGTAVDVTSGNDGALNGGGYAVGQVDSAFNLDGQDDYVLVPESGSSALDGLSAMTVEAWIRPDSLGWPNPEQDSNYDAAIISKFDSTEEDGVSFQLSLRDGRLRFAVVGEGSPLPVARIVSDDTVALAEWTHVAAVWSGGDQLALFINGAQAAATTSTQGGPVNYTADNETPVNIGRVESYSGSHNGPAAFFDGLIDEVTVYGRTLTHDEIAAVSSLGGKCKDSESTAVPPDNFLPAVFKPQATPTPVPYQFVKAETSPLYLQNFNNDLGCNWLGVGGEVLSQDGDPMPAGVFQVHVWNSTFDARVVAGSVPAYGPSGWEITLGYVPVVDAYNIQLEIVNGVPISEVYAFATRTACNQNLVIFNFIESPWLSNKSRH